VDAQRFISSGLIDMYIAGAATEQEVQEVETAMIQSPEVAAEVDASRRGMEFYVKAQSVNPPISVKDNLLFLIQAEKDEHEFLATPDIQESQIPETDPSKRFNVTRFALAASIALLLGSVVFNLVLLSSNKEFQVYKEKYQTLLAAQNTLLTQNDTYKTRMVEMEQSMDMMKNPAVKKVKMVGTKPFPDAMATVYWNATSREVFLNVNQLPPPAPDKQYQLWAIVDGKPVDMGVFDMDNAANQLCKMKSVANAQMFAVTLEKKGGSPVPTMDQMYVAGKV
jgi:anti-sigma-K factor RskA